MFKRLIWGISIFTLMLLGVAVARPSNVDYIVGKVFSSDLKIEIVIKNTGIMPEGYADNWWANKNIVLIPDVPLSKDISKPMPENGKIKLKEVGFGGYTLQFVGMSEKLIIDRQEMKIKIVYNVTPQGYNYDKLDIK